MKTCPQCGKSYIDFCPCWPITRHIDDFSLHSSAVDKIVLLSATLAGVEELLKQIKFDAYIPARSGYDRLIQKRLTEIETVLGRKAKRTENKQP